MTPQRLEQVQLRADVDVERRHRLVERRLNERLRGEMEDAVRLDGPDEVVDGAGVGELAVEERDPALLRLVAQPALVAEAPLDEVDLAGAPEVLEILHARAPAHGPVDRDVGMLGEEVLGKVASGKASDAGDEDAHQVGNLASSLPSKRRAGPPPGQEHGEQGAGSKDGESDATGERALLLEVEPGRPHDRELERPVRDGQGVRDEPGARAAAPQRARQEADAEKALGEMRRAGDELDLGLEWE